jgi:hypothetical protein
MFHHVYQFHFQQLCMVANDSVVLHQYAFDSNNSDKIVCIIIMYNQIIMYDCIINKYCCSCSIALSNRPLWGIPRPTKPWRPGLPGVAHRTSPLASRAQRAESESSEHRQNIGISWNIMKIWEYNERPWFLIAIIISELIYRKIHRQGKFIDVWMVRILVAFGFSLELIHPVTFCNPNDSQGISWYHAWRWTVDKMWKLRCARLELVTSLREPFGRRPAL